MKKQNYALLTSLLIASFGFTFYAVAAPAKEKEDIRWYQVEIILFTQNDEASLAEEDWDHESAVEFPEQPQMLYRGKTSLNKLPAEPIPFTTVLKNETDLKGIANRLSRSARTQPILHLAWIQPTKKDSPLDNVHIYPGAGAADYKEAPSLTRPTGLAYEAGSGFDGLISLKREHYLHLNIDMGYQERNQNNLSEPVFNEEGFYSETARIPSYSSYRMKQKRRIRSGEIHYFDHPRFALIAQVTPIELPKPEVIEKPVTPIELPIPVENKSKPTATSLQPSR
ncbi:MAG: hypothetical protein DRQ56_03960 [Gammaproteobacteria bacterium]|nr:MAG: hypothetical protein DRQ56_03960 [Gammaproteobacteria bacterium]